MTKNKRFSWGYSHYDSTGEIFDWSRNECLMTDYLQKYEIEEWCQELNKIVDENEQLKKENKKLHRVIEENEKMIQSIYEELTKLRCIKSNLRRIKSNWDWIMEAIQYD